MRALFFFDRGPTWSLGSKIMVQTTFLGILGLINILVPLQNFYKLPKSCFRSPLYQMYLSRIGVKYVFSLVVSFFFFSCSQNFCHCSRSLPQNVFISPWIKLFFHLSCLPKKNFLLPPFKNDRHLSHFEGHYEHFKK